MVTTNRKGTKPSGRGFTDNHTTAIKEAADVLSVINRHFNNKKITLGKIVPRRPTQHKHIKVTSADSSVHVIMRGTNAIQEARLYGFKHELPALLSVIRKNWSGKVVFEAR